MAETTGTFQSSLAELLAEHGFNEPRAERIASRLVCDYPMVRRLGPDAMALRLQQWGLDEESARDATFDLLAFELLGRLPYDRVLAEIGRHVDAGGALGACLRASTVRRCVRRGPPLEEPSRLRARLLRTALQWLR